VVCTRSTAAGGVESDRRSHRQHRERGGRLTTLRLPVVKGTGEAGPTAAPVTTKCSRLVHVTAPLGTRIGAGVRDGHVTLTVPMRDTRTMEVDQGTVMRMSCS